METVRAVLTLLMVLVLFAVVLGLAYWATKFVGKRFAAGGQGSRYIKVLDRVPLGQAQQLLLVRVADRTLLVGATNQGFTTLCEVEEELPDMTPEEPPVPFSQLFGSLLNQKKDGNRPDGR